MFMGEKLFERSIELVILRFELYQRTYLQSKFKYIKAYSLSVSL